MPKFLFDTNALNAFLDKGINPADVPAGVRCYVTAAQVSELNATSHSERREALLSHFFHLEKEVPVERESLRSGPYGTSPYGLAPYGGGEGRHFRALKNRLDCAPGNRSRRGNTTDALTLEACIYGGAHLVTSDPSLIKLAVEYGVPVATPVEFIEFMRHEIGRAK